MFVLGFSWVRLKVSRYKRIGYRPISGSLEGGPLFRRGDALSLSEAEGESEPDRVRKPCRIVEAIILSQLVLRLG